MEKTIGDIKFRRRRESVTDYRKRLSLVKSGIDRVIVRKSNRRIIGQVVKYKAEGDMVLVHADSAELSAFGWPSRPNRPTAYLTGLLLAKKSGSSAGSDHILDIGLASPVKDSIPFVFAKGCIDGGMTIRGSIAVDEKVYNYSNAKYAAEAKSKDSAVYQRQYSAYLKEGHAPENLGREFAEAKEKVMKSEGKKE